MSFTIAIGGKGGSGKTTLAALLIQRLAARGSTPVLAVDADPNSCLDAALGVTVSDTVGAVREQVRELAGAGSAGAASKQEMLELKIHQSLVEAEHFDLIAMGRCEGPGCYCYANNVLRQVIERLSDAYPVMVIDNEAGLENLSRRIVRRVDLLILVSDPSRAGLRTVERLHQLAGEMELCYDRLALVVNRVRDDAHPHVDALRDRVQADVVLNLPDDAAVAQLAERGDSLVGADLGGPLVEGIDHLLDEAGPR